MKVFRHMLVLAFVILASAAIPVPAQSLDDVVPPDDVMLLVQSELDLLPAAKLKVTVRFEKWRPATVIQELRDRTGMTIEVRGTLPDQATLSASFREAEVKDVLNWFAGQVPASFRAHPPNKLSVIVEELREPPRKNEGS